MENVQTNQSVTPWATLNQQLQSTAGQWKCLNFSFSYVDLIKNRLITIDEVEYSHSVLPRYIGSLLRYSIYTSKQLNVYGRARDFQAAFEEMLVAIFLLVIFALPFRLKMRREVASKRPLIYFSAWSLGCLCFQF